MGYFEVLWGRGMRLDDLTLDRLRDYVAARRGGALGKEGGAKPGTVRNDLRCLRRICHWARGHRTGGRPLLLANPLDGFRLADIAYEGADCVVLRPVASEERYQATLATVGQVDREGRLEIMLRIARGTGRRISAIRHLKASDLLLSPAQVERALAEAGQDIRKAKRMPFGAIRWRAEHDKKKRTRIAPISPEVRAALEAHLQRHPRIGEVWVFTNEDPEKPIPDSTADLWLRRAEIAAGLPLFERGCWHPYRRLWASERKHLPDVDVAEAGGWSDPSTMKRSYQQPDDEGVLEAILYAPRHSGTDGHKSATPPAEVEG